MPPQILSRFSPNRATDISVGHQSSPLGDSPSIRCFCTSDAPPYRATASRCEQWEQAITLGLQLQVSVWLLGLPPPELFPSTLQSPLVSAQTSGGPFGHWAGLNSPTPQKPFQVLAIHALFTRLLRPFTPPAPDNCHYVRLNAAMMHTASLRSRDVRTTMRHFIDLSQLPA